MAGSSVDQRFYQLECSRCHVIETVPLRDLQGIGFRHCPTCGQMQDLTVEPHLSTLREEFAAAEKEDLKRQPE
jgi:hypothetical protein